MQSSDLFSSAHGGAMVARIGFHTGRGYRPLCGSQGKDYGPGERLILQRGRMKQIN